MPETCRDIYDNKYNYCIKLVPLVSFMYINICKSVLYSRPITGLERPFGFQEVEAPKISRQGKVVSHICLSVHMVQLGYH